MSKLRLPTYHRRRSTRLQLEEQTRAVELQMRMRLQALADQALVLHMTRPQDVRLLAVDTTPDTQDAAAALVLPASDTRH